jgi:hypothetical protein
MTDTLTATTTDLGTLRAYWRCPDCLTVFCTDVPKPAPPTYPMPYGYNLPTSVLYLRAFTPICAVCAVDVTPMGTVGPSGDVTLTSIKTVCDYSCQYALGPACDCHCGGMNHGDRLSRLIVVLETRGTRPVVSKLDPDGEAGKRAAEFKAAVEAAGPAIKARYPEIDRVLAAKAAGRWVPNEDFTMMLAWRRDLKALDSAKTMKTHKARMAKLSKLAGSPLDKAIEAARTA